MRRIPMSLLHMAPPPQMFLRYILVHGSGQAQALNAAALPLGRRNISAGTSGIFHVTRTLPRARIHRRRPGLQYCN